MQKQRNSAIDLLKIFSMLGVILLHYNNRSIGQAFNFLPMFSAKSYLLYFLQAVFVCAVNVFVLISGYFMADATKVDVKKPIRLLIQVVVFRELIYIVQTLCDGKALQTTYLWRFLLPQSWFAVLYAALYILAPFINRFLSSLSAKSQRTFLYIAFFLFSVWPYSVEILQEFTGISFSGLGSIGMYGGQFGYTIVNFFLMYVIGAILKRQSTDYKLYPSLIGLLVCWSLIFGFGYFLEAQGRDTRFSFSYFNPTVILSAVFLFRCFNKLQIKSNAFISSISKATFSVYLLNSTLIAELVHTQRYVQGNGWIMLLHLTATCIGIYALCWLAQLLYDLITKPIYRLTDRLPINTVIKVESPE
jgi:surface polysaccharide O-acyltransferase-like enzyme